jgi:hypothetical protein
MKVVDLIRFLEGVPSDFEVIATLVNENDGSYTMYQIEESEQDFAERHIYINFK